MSEREALLEKLKEAGIVSVRDELIRRQTEGAQVARTESGDPSFNIPDEVKKEISRAISNNLTHYTPGAGIPQLREAIVTKLRNTNRINTKKENIFVTSGAMNALYVVFRALTDFKLSKVDGWLGLKPPYSILVPTPTWTEMVTNIELSGAKPVYYNLNPASDNPIDLDALRNSIQPDTIAMVINTPHNPTGTILNADTISNIVDICKEANIYLITDEAYEHIVYEPYKHVSAGLFEYDKTISIYSFSKSYAMSGLRIGYIDSHIEGLNKLIAKYIRCTVNGVNSITQHGATAALTEVAPAQYFDPMLAEYRKRRDLLVDGLNQCSFLEPIVPNGAFYVWAKIKEDWEGYSEEKSGWDATLYLLEHGIGSAPGECFGPGGKGYIRFAFSCNTDHIEVAAKTLAQL